MSADDNKALVRRYIQEVWDKNNSAALDEFLASNYQRHISPNVTPLNREGQKQRLAGIRTAFPDIALTLEEIIAENDRVAFRSTIRGTHQNIFQGIAPTGRQVTISLLDLVRVEDNKIIEQWGGPDFLDWLRQLGAVVS
ncbi:nogalonic acid methyl ester cyclase / aklanonic acid methyl ester cyclase [Anaerolineae bacterium]|nr:nogalonic acid methyl ester cyclase / aklanonic acid methyl ester cyclase [Anaerolineae bacterium]